MSHKTKDDTFFLKSHSCIDECSLQTSPSSFPIAAFSVVTVSKLASNSSTCAQNKALTHLPWLG